MTNTTSSTTPPYQAAPYAPEYSQEEEKNVLKKRSDLLEQQLKEINSRLQELEKEQD